MRYVLSAVFFLLPMQAFGYQAAVTAAAEAPEEAAPSVETEAVQARSEKPTTAPEAAASNKSDEKGDDFEPETLAGLGDIDHGGYGGPVVRYSRMAGEDVVQVGGRGGWLINHRLLIGGAGYGVANQPAPPASIYSPTGRALEMSIGYGGFFTEYLLAPSKLIHATVGVLVGAGGISVYERNGHRDENRQIDAFERDDGFFVVEPEIGIELNVFKFMRVNLTGGYRFVTGVNGIGLENSDLRAPSGALALKFGQF